jgi:hypothetical protein
MGSKAEPATALKAAAETWPGQRRRDFNLAI